MDPVSAPQARELDASRGWAWIAQGFELFRKAPGPWIAIFLIWVVVYAVASVIPGGGLLTALFGEVLMGGMMLGCRALDTGGELKVEHLFAGFRSEQLTQLIVVGALSLAGMVAIFLVVGVVVGGSMLPLLWGKSASTNVAQIGLGLLLGTLVFLALIVPVLMATWFAPALVLFDRLAAIDAMKLSFGGCLRNLVPFLLYGVIGCGLLIVAAIPLGLGLLILSPVLIASVYTSYCDIFDRRFAERPAGG